MMGEEELGAAILRAQADDATWSDLRLIVETIMTSEEFRRARLPLIGTFTAEIEQATREQYCRAMAMILLSDYRPPSPSVDKAVQTTTSYFVKNCAPAPRGLWESQGHIDAAWTSRGQAQSVAVSPYLTSILQALEAMWNCKGHLIPRV